MAVQYSTQHYVSDGTLSTIVLGIKYVLRTNIYLRIDGVETPQTGASSGYTWSFLDATTIKVLPIVPIGITVEVYRRTDITGMYNVFSQNAQFDEGTIDENNTQLLYIAQEYLEQGLPGVGIAALEYVRSEPSYEIYRFQRSDGTYFPEFPIPADTAALEPHKVNADQHPISGVTGLSNELAQLNSRINNAALATDVVSLATDVVSLATRVSVVDGKVSVLEQRKSTCLVNATGTGAPHETVVTQLPINIAINTRYVLPNPFGNNTPVICWAELLLNGIWADTGFISTQAGGFGTKATYAQGKGVVVQTGSSRLSSSSAITGGGHGTLTEATSAPCRVFVRKLEA